MSRLVRHLLQSAQTIDDSACGRAVRGSQGLWRKAFDQLVTEHADIRQGLSRKDFSFPLRTS